MDSRSTNKTSSANANPFLSPAFANPFATAATAAAETAATTGYELVKHGPSVDASEVEDAAAAAMEVSILWGDTVLHVAHLSPPRAFHVGEEQGKHIGCDFLLPSEKLGATRAPLVLVEGGRAFAVVLPGATGTIEIPGRSPMSLADAVATGVLEPCAELSGAHRIAMPAMAKLTMRLGDLRFVIAAVAAGKKIPVGLLRAAGASALGFVGLSFLVHASMLAGMAFFKPSLSGTDDDESRREREVLMQQMLRASAVKKEEALKEQVETPSEGATGGQGAKAAGESGAAGTNAPKTNGRIAVKGPKDNPDPRLAREAAKAEAATFGIIGMLNNGMGGDPKAPTAPWGDVTSSGRDELSARGNFWGTSLDDSFGSGLGLTGTGEGGDGKYSGIGLGEIGFGRGKGLGDDAGFGRSHGKALGDHVVKSPPAVRMAGPTTVSGRIPSEVIQRIVRQNFGRFRMCYERGLKSNPTLSGRVAVRFAIDRRGTVATTSNAGSDLPDSAVVSCVVSSFAGMSFPEPEGGIVTVVYPITFTPGSLADLATSA